MQSTLYIYALDVLMIILRLLSLFYTRTVKLATQDELERF